MDVIHIVTFTSNRSIVIKMLNCANALCSILQIPTCTTHILIPIDNQIIGSSDLCDKKFSQLYVGLIITQGHHEGLHFVCSMSRIHCPRNFCCSRNLQNKGLRERINGHVYCKRSPYRHFCLPSHSIVPSRFTTTGKLVRSVSMGE
jgi:hypothetical protein